MPMGLSQITGSVCVAFFQAFTLETLYDLGPGPSAGLPLDSMVPLEAIRY